MRYIYISTCSGTNTHYMPKHQDSLGTNIVPDSAHVPYFHTLCVTHPIRMRMYLFPLREMQYPYLMYMWTCWRNLVGLDSVSLLGILENSHGVCDGVPLKVNVSLFVYVMKSEKLLI